MKVLTYFATDPSLRLHVRLEVTPEMGISQTLVEEIAAALRALKLDDRKLQVEELPGGSQGESPNDS